MASSNAVGSNAVGRVVRLWNGRRWAAARDARGVFVAPVLWGLMQSERTYLAPGTSPKQAIAVAQTRERGAAEHPEP